MNWQAASDVLTKVYQEYGVLVTLLFFMVLYFMRKADKAKERHIQTLEKELERVIESRNKLEGILLNDRLSSKLRNNEIEDKSENKEK